VRSPTVLRRRVLHQRRGTSVDGARNDKDRVDVAAGRAFTIAGVSRTDAKTDYCGSGRTAGDGARLESWSPAIEPPPLAAMNRAAAAPSHIRFSTSEPLV
jgi:hypothetical protein